MNITKTRQAVNLVSGGAGKHYLFNDRLQDGRRSLKVYGWRYADYKKAADILLLAGCKVQIKRGPFSMSECRLIVDEG